MHIGILQTGHLAGAMREKFGDHAALFARLFEPHGFEFSVWNVVDMEFPGGPGVAEGWLVTGSRHAAYDDLPWIPRLEELIRDIHAADRPLVGVCFGHQIVAQAMGGRVEKFDGGWAVGRDTYDWDGRGVTLNAWHQDQVTAAPDGAETLAGNDFCAHAALLYGDRMFTVQPHPEFGDDAVAGLIASYESTGGIPEELLSAARGGLGRGSDRRDIAASMAGFLKERRL